MRSLEQPLLPQHRGHVDVVWRKLHGLIGVIVADDLVIRIVEQRDPDLVHTAGVFS